MDSYPLTKVEHKIKRHIYANDYAIARDLFLASSMSCSQAHWTGILTQPSSFPGAPPWKPKVKADLRINLVLRRSATGRPSSRGL